LQTLFTLPLIEFTVTKVDATTGFPVEVSFRSANAARKPFLVSMASLLNNFKGSCCALPKCPSAAPQCPDTSAVFRAEKDQLLMELKKAKETKCADPEPCDCDQYECPDTSALCRLEKEKLLAELTKARDVKCADPEPCPDPEQCDPLLVCTSDRQKLQECEKMFLQLQKKKDPQPCDASVICWSDRMKLRQKEEEKCDPDVICLSDRRKLKVLEEEEKDSSCDPNIVCLEDKVKLLEKKECPDELPCDVDVVCLDDRLKAMEQADPDVVCKKERDLLRKWDEFRCPTISPAVVCKEEKRKLLDMHRLQLQLKANLTAALRSSKCEEYEVVCHDLIMQVEDLKLKETNFSCPEAELPAPCPSPRPPAPSRSSTTTTLPQQANMCDPALVCYDLLQQQQQQLGMSLDEAKKVLLEKTVTSLVGLEGGDFITVVVLSVLFAMTLLTLAIMTAFFLKQSGCCPKGAGSAAGKKLGSKRKWSWRPWWSSPRGTSPRRRPSDKDKSFKSTIELQVTPATPDSNTKPVPTPRTSHYIRGDRPLFSDSEMFTTPTNAPPVLGSFIRQSADGNDCRIVA